MSHCKGRWSPLLNTGNLLMLPNMDSLLAINTGHRVPKLLVAYKAREPA
jgi:hypothetical protein